MFCSSQDELQMETSQMTFCIGKYYYRNSILKFFLNLVNFEKPNCKHVEYLLFLKYPNDKF